MIQTLLLSLGLIAAGSVANAQDSSKSNVVLLMLDGVRWQEVFHGVDPTLASGAEPHFESLFSGLNGKGILYGDFLRGDQITVSNPALNSLPAYQSIMAGTTQDCRSNACGRIKVQTVEERLVKEGGMKREEVATIASWEKIANAVEHTEGTTFVNAGMTAMLDGADREEVATINRAQEKDTPSWSGARYDKYTIAQGMRYLKAHHPRFLFISLNDSDEWGHKGNYPKYVETLSQYKVWINSLTAALSEMGEYGKNTTIIVTSDHGRGTGKDWSDHGSGYPESKSIWIYAQSPQTLNRRGLAATPARVYTHLDLRPTIERILGLVPEPALPGKPIEEILGH